MIGNVHRKKRYVDYCCVDKMSLVEINNMAKQLRINVDGCTFWLLDLNNNHNGLVEIKKDSNALLMVSYIDYARVIYMHARGSKADVSASCSNVAVSSVRSVGPRSGGASDEGVAIGQGDVGVEECVEDGEEAKRRRKLTLKALFLGIKVSKMRIKKVSCMT